MGRREDKCSGEVLQAHNLPYNDRNFLWTFWHYWVDWLFVAVYAAVALGLTKAPVRDRFKEPTNPDFQYPYQEDFVTFSVCCVMVIAIPIFCFIVTNLVYVKMLCKDWNYVLDFHHSLLGLLESSSVCILATNSLKIAVGRVRPSGSARHKLDMHDWNQSYPSGHTSMIFCGMVYLFLFLSGKAGILRKTGIVFSKSQDPFRGSFAFAFLTFFLPMVIACFVLASRLVDYAHDFSDVNAGAVIGLVSAFIGYFLCYPSLMDDHCHMPRPMAYIQRAKQSPEHRDPSLKLLE
uniref:Phosphatidic acid phosphatase type 2/haloperoxidase domain-containing protein n=1 Tax=Mucochytrium quahogii TaxID=96639 RepID=A0A7S2RYR7_9STRA|mmetsp:Transcript_14804/g.24089  ORF Transcript_14804/g.24089 Transcript_14804/m.24089 type:complete len:291 (+) Transcript_14804:511-1383(+)